MGVLLEAGRATVERDERGLRIQLPATTLRPEKVLFAAGRAGNTEGLGLTEVGVETDERGRIVVDPHFQTTAPGVYAAGDVIGPPGLASVPMEQARVATCHALGIQFKETVDPLAPFAVYSIPEVAMVGMTEEAVTRAGIDYEVGRGWFDQNTRATISGATDGFVKLVFRRADKRLLGVHILGATAAELIHLGQAVLHFEGRIDYFIDTTFAVPTESEAFKYAAYDGLSTPPGRRVLMPGIGASPSAPIDRDYLDGIGNTLEGDGARPGDPRIVRCGFPARQDLAAFGESGDPRRLVDSSAPEIVLNLGCGRGVDADANLWGEAVRAPMLGERALDRDRAAERCIGCVEADEEAIACGDHFLATMCHEEPSQGLVVPVEQRLPRLITDGLDEVGRLHDVREHERLDDPVGRHHPRLPQLPGEKILHLFQHQRLGGA
jgi:hypothetical protein